MRTLLVYVLALLLVGGLLFLAASFAFGRDEEMAAALPGGTPVELPDDRPATGADLRALRLAVVLRGYRMEEVDWVLDRLAEQVDARDREIARLRSVLHVEPVATPTGSAEDTERLGAPDDPVPDHDHEPALTPDRAAPADREPVADRRPGAADRMRAPERVEAPVRSDAPVRVEPPVRERRTGPGDGPVRGLRPDGTADRDPR